MRIVTIRNSQREKKRVRFFSVGLVLGARKPDSNRIVRQQFGDLTGLLGFAKKKLRKEVAEDGGFREYAGGAGDGAGGRN